MTHDSRNPSDCLDELLDGANKKGFQGFWKPFISFWLRDGGTRSDYAATPAIIGSDPPRAHPLVESNPCEELDGVDNQLILIPRTAHTV